MMKMQTLFEQDEKYRVLPKLRANIKNYEVYHKRDGTSCMIKDNKLYKRYNANLRKGRKIPNGAILCQEEPSPVNGDFPVWIPITKKDYYHQHAFDYRETWEDGTYELCGEKINGNKENINGHILIPHNSEPILGIKLEYDFIKEYLSDRNIEGLVIKDLDTDIMYKIRRKDFGFKW